MKKRALLVVFTITALTLCGCYSTPKKTVQTPRKSTVEVTKEKRIEISHEPEKLNFPARIPKRRLNVPILMYHRVGRIIPGSNSVAVDLTVKPSNFKKQMRLLRSMGFRSISLRELFKALFFNVALPGKAIVITFDDGYEDGYSEVFPTLRSGNLAGTFFVVSERVGSKDHMSWKELVEMQRGGMEIGSHSSNHPDLRSLSPVSAWKEILSSKNTLEKHLKNPIYFFCYPSGRYSDETLMMVKRAGYLIAVTTHHGTEEKSNAPFELPRLRIHRSTTIQEFTKLLNK